MSESVAVANLSPEDAKLATLAKGSRGRISANQGAALRDETGRTYASASVQLEALRLSAVQAVVAQAVAAGAKGVEAVVVVGVTNDEDSAGKAAVSELGGSGVPIMTIEDGRDGVLTWRT